VSVLLDWRTKEQIIRTSPLLLFGIIVKVATNCAPHTPLVVLQPWIFFKPMLLKTMITFILIFSCFRFTPGLAFGEKDIGHPAITEYLSLTGQGKLRNKIIISERNKFLRKFFIGLADRQRINFCHTF
jgi:hypothetical protein